MGTVYEASAGTITSTGSINNLWSGLSSSEKELVYYMESNAMLIASVNLANAGFSRYLYMIVASECRFDVYRETSPQSVVVLFNPTVNRALCIVDKYSDTSYRGAIYSYNPSTFALGINDGSTAGIVTTDYDMFDNYQSAYDALFNPVATYPITYHYANSTVSGPSEAAVGDTVTVSAVPDVGYGITDASTQILVTNDDVAVPYTWDAANQRITFTMPQPAD